MATWQLPVVLLCLGVVLGDNIKAPLLHTDGKEIIPDEYLVIYHKNISAEAVLKHERKLEMHVYDHEFKVMKKWSFGSFHGYSIKAPSGLIEKLREESSVRYIEANQVMKINQACTEQTEATWGLVRTNERQLLLDGLYDYKKSAGAGVDAYVIDTGVYLEHVEFGGRAVWGVDMVDTPSPESDLNGHGTHVAGTIAGSNYGLAKQAAIIAVRVLNAGGSGSTAGVVDGVLWTGTEHSKKKNARSVANMSLGGSASTAMNEAVAEAVLAGVVFVVASGNSAFDACNFSPASEPTAITVSCSNNLDEFCSFSNYGTCVDIIAPGQDITSSWIGGKYAVNTISGTSMSSPHVAGVAAKYMSEATTVPTPKEVASYLSLESTRNMITAIPDTITPNHLVYKGCQ